MLSLILIVLAFVLFLVGTIPNVSPRLNLIAAGLAAYVAAQLVTRAGW